MENIQQQYLQKYIDVYVGVSHKSNQELQQIIDSLYPSIENTKQVLVKYHDEEIPLTIIHRPSSISCVLWFIGGAFQLDTTRMNQFYVDMFEDSTVILVNPNSYSYKQNKEINEYLFDWICNHRVSLAIPFEQIFVGGVGSGAIYAMLLAQTKKQQISYCFSFYPLLCKEEYQPKPLWSIEKHQEVYQMVGKEIEKDFHDFNEITSILLVSSKFDPYVDQTRKYAVTLNQNQVDVLYQEFDYGFYGFEILAKDTNLAKQAFELEQQLYQYVKEKYKIKLEINEDVITEEEIEEISRKISMIPLETPKEVEEVVEEKKPEKEVEPFSRDDVMKLLKNKEIERTKVVVKPFVEEEKEDVYSNLKKIIEEDTKDSLKDIDELINRL